MIAILDGRRNGSCGFTFRGSFNLSALVDPGPPCHRRHPCPAAPAQHRIAGSNKDRPGRRGPDGPAYSPCRCPNAAAGPEITINEAATAPFAGPQRDLYADGATNGWTGCANWLRFHQRGAGGADAVADRRQWQRPANKSPVGPARGDRFGPGATRSPPSLTRRCPGARAVPPPPLPGASKTASFCRRRLLNLVRDRFPVAGPRRAFNVDIDELVTGRTRARRDGLRRGPPRRWGYATFPGETWRFTAADRDPPPDMPIT